MIKTDRLCDVCGEKGAQEYEFTLNSFSKTYKDLCIRHLWAHFKELENRSYSYTRIDAFNSVGTTR